MYPLARKKYKMNKAGYKVIGTFVRDEISKKR